MDERTTALAALLKTRDWKAADGETRRLLIDDVDIGGYVGVDADEAARIDCDLLVGIDSLWTAASDARFGLSVQEGILAEEIARDLASNDTWRMFGRRVGWVEGREWIEDGDVRYSLDAPIGHLPYVPGIGTVVNTGRIYEGYLLFYSRVADCIT
jgi:hypothetical protein